MLYCGQEKSLMVLTERDVEKQPLESGCACSIDILFLPCKYRGDTIQETGRIVSSYNPNLWVALAPMLWSNGEGTIEFY